MNVLVGICTLVLAALVVLFVSRPLRRLTPAPAEDEAGVPELADGQSKTSSREQELRRAGLEAAREAKYREIRDAELDYRTGKLSREDYNAIDADLRAEALEILDGLQKLGVDLDAPEPSLPPRGEAAAEGSADPQASLAASERRDSGHEDPAA